MAREVQRSVLPIPDQPSFGLVTYDAREALYEGLTPVEPNPSAPAGQLGFKFDRSGYRVPAIVISPWAAEGGVFNQEHRHTSLIATLREQWARGDPLTGRDAAARTFTHALTLDTPRDPSTWPVPDPRPVPEYIQDALASARPSPPSAEPSSTGYGHTPSSTTSRSTDCPQIPRLRSLQGRHCTSSITSSRSSSPCCIRPPRDPAPQPDCDVR